MPKNEPESGKLSTQRASTKDGEYTEFLARREGIRRMEAELANPERFVARIQLLGKGKDPSKYLAELEEQRALLASKNAAAEDEFGSRAVPHGRSQFSRESLMDYLRLMRMKRSISGPFLNPTKKSSKPQLIKIPISKGGQQTDGGTQPPPPCPEIIGYAAAGTCRSVTTRLPDDSDTEMEDHPLIFYPGSKQVASHKVVMRDKTHFYSHDSEEIWGYWFAVSFNLPEAPCDGWYNWYSCVEHNVSLWGGAEYRSLYSEWLVSPDNYYWDAAWANQDPSALEDFRQYSGYWSNHVNNSVYDYMVYTSSDREEEAPIVGGAFTVKAGDQPRVWLGLHMVYAAREGKLGSGWNHLSIWAPDWYEYGVEHPGIGYAFFPS